MRQRIIDNLLRAAGDSEALAPVQREQFLVYLMGPYRTFDVDALLPADANVETDAPSFATWNKTSGEYAEDEVLRLLQETRYCLRDRGFNAFLAIDVGIPLEEMDAATQSIAFAQASNATVFIAPQVGDSIGVGIERTDLRSPKKIDWGAVADRRDSSPSWLMVAPEFLRRVIQTVPTENSIVRGTMPHTEWRRSAGRERSRSTFSRSMRCSCSSSTSTARRCLTG
jgi:hypothetical protein